MLVWGNFEHLKTQCTPNYNTVKRLVCSLGKGY